MLNLTAQRVINKAITVSDADIAMTCRVRLARNLVKERFPDWATNHDRLRIFTRVSEAVKFAVPEFRVCPVSEIGERDRAMLCESHLVSKELLAREVGGGVGYALDGSVCVMINEEDHLRIQGFGHGLALEAAWQVADKLDTALEKHLNFAWNPKYGYLTACPSNLGTGLRASAMLHLLGLRLMGEIEPVVRGLERMRLLVRGMLGEGSEAAGQICQISNMDALGLKESEIIGRVKRLCSELIRQEHHARIRLLQQAPLVLLDGVARSLSVLQSARLITAVDSIEFLSALRLGASLGLLTQLKVAEVDRLILLVQPGHLQKDVKGEMSVMEHDALRADFLRSEVAAVRVKC